MKTQNIIVNCQFLKCSSCNNKDFYLNDNVLYCKDCKRSVGKFDK